MSFSSEVKKELSQLNNLKNKEEVRYELLGYLITSNTSNNKIKYSYSTENKYNINRFNKLLNNLNMDYNICIKGRLFVIEFYLENKCEYKSFFNNIKNSTTNLKKAFVRGVFLGSGSINNPNKKYNIEITLRKKEYLIIVKDILEEFNIKFKEFERKNSYSLYTKEGEEISEFLAFIGASKAVIEYEEIRVIRDIRNNVNRKVNCETANLNKTVKAAVRQIEDIKYIYKVNAEDRLSDNLKEIANLRMENPDISLIELGKLLKEPIGKSGVNHRLKKIQEIANELRGNK